MALRAIYHIIQYIMHGKINGASAPTVFVQAEQRHDAVPIGYAFANHGAVTLIQPMAEEALLRGIHWQ